MPHTVFNFFAELSILRVRDDNAQTSRVPDRGPIRWFATPDQYRRTGNDATGRKS
jgi:hypothetical protein